MGHSHVVHASRFAQAGQLAERPSPARIAAYSTVIALHAAAFVLLMMPMAAPAPDAPRDEVVIHYDKIPIVRPTPVPPPPKPTPATVRVTTHTTTPTTPVPPVVLNDDSAMSLPDADTTQTEDVVTIPSTPDTTPVSDAQLVYASAPPPVYPREEERRRIEGAVLLKVLVGVDGKPIEVTIQSSSGNRKLDEAARKQVLQHWLFQPATRNGVAVQAIGMVPIHFTVR